MARHADIPFERDQSTRFLPWIVAVMVFLAALAAAFALVVGESIDAWDASLTGRVTVQVPVGPGDDAGATADRRAADVAKRLGALPGVASAAVMPDAAVRALLAPWLGTAPDGVTDGKAADDGAADDGAADAALPLPRLVDVTLADTGIDAASLRAAVADVGPDIVVDDHRVWLKPLIDLARLVELIALLVLVLIGSAAVATVVFATRSGLAVHASIIELLHLMGAHDDYVARQFQAHAMRLGLRGGLAGSVAAAIVLAAIYWVARGIDTALLPHVTPNAYDGALLAAVPVAGVVIAMTTARVTVLRALARLP